MKIWSDKATLGGKVCAMVAIKLRQDIAPEFRDRYNAIFDEWQSGSLSFNEAVAAIELLKKDAITSGQLANQGGAELIIGIMQGYRANLNESIKHFERARELFAKVGNRERVAVCTLNVGESYRLKGNFTQARRFFHAAYEAASQLGDIKMQVTALVNEGQMLMSMGRYEQARASLEDAYQISHSSWGDDPTLEKSRLDSLCEIHHSLAVIHLTFRDTTVAWQHAKELFQIATQLRLAYRLGFANRALAEVITETGKPLDPTFDPDPDVYFQAATEAFREVKAEGELAKTMLAHGKSLARRGKRMQSARKLQQAMVIFTRLGMVDDAAKAAEAQLRVL